MRDSQIVVGNALPGVPNRDSSAGQNIRATILPRIRRGHDLPKGKDMARTRYQHGEIVIKHGKQHDSYMGRWVEDVRLPGGSIARRKRSRVLGIVGTITEKQAARQLEGILARINDPAICPNQTAPFRLLPKSGVTKRF